MEFCWKYSSGNEYSKSTAGSCFPSSPGKFPGLSYGRKRVKHKIEMLSASMDHN
jgi:hypothetical protein